MKTGLPECRSFEQYNPAQEYDEYSSHGEKVIRSFQEYSDKAYKILPLSIDSGGQLKPLEIVNRFFEIFDCLSKVSQKFNLAGVNISSGAREFLISDLTEEQKRVLLSIENKFTSKIRSFLSENKSTIVTMALGNAPSRLRDSISLPLSAVCNSKINSKNLFCVTSFYFDKVYDFGASLSTPRKFRVGSYTYSYIKNPNGTIDSPFPITGRFATSNRLIAIDGIRPATSFKSPSLLALLLNRKVEIKEGFGLSYNENSSFLETYPIKYLIR